LASALRVWLLVALMAGSALFALPTRVALAQSPDDGFDPRANSPVYVLAVQTDGKILVGASSPCWAALQTPEVR
jgi:hypothetical protein